MAGFNVFAADSDAEAELLASSQQQAFVALRTGNPRQLPPPVAGYRESLGAAGRARSSIMCCNARRSAARATVARGIAAFVERTGADELMIASAIYDHDARKRSLAITAGGDGERCGMLAVREAQLAAGSRSRTSSPPRSSLSSRLTVPS